MTLSSFPPPPADMPYREKKLLDDALWEWRKKLRAKGRGLKSMNKICAAHREIVWKEPKVKS